ncbi:MAG: patatin-like phospholipase family protein [Gemmobacter sp.]
MVIRVNLALQGGGAHGAFTWGVLERLLDEPGIEVAAISGTSAGALNGAAFKAGMLEDGRAGARAALADLWAQVGAAGDWRVQAWMLPFIPFASAWTEAVEAMMPVSPQGLAAQLFSPYAYGPAWRNPLERVVKRFRFDRVCAHEPPALFVSATNVRTGKIRVFEGSELSTEAILASACLPTLFQAVEMHDPGTGATEAFWDGGYTGNPALFPLFDPGLPDDVIVVSINPLRREDLPRTPFEIQSRINEISFNSSLLREMRAINFVKELIADGRIARGTMKDVRLHMIADDALMNDLSASTKVAPTPFLLHRLRSAGHAAADAFLRENGAALGQRTTLDLPALMA